MLVSPPLRTCTSPLPCEIRYLVASDMEAVMGIESDSFPDPWDDEQFRHVRKEGFIEVAVSSKKIVGFSAWLFLDDAIDIVNLAVATDLRRRSIGLQLLSKLASRIRHGPRRTIQANVRDDNMAFQYLLRAHKPPFVATRVLRAHFPPPGEADAYHFELNREAFREPVTRIIH